MARFQADALDLSRLPEPTLVTVDYETIRSERLAALKAKYAERGIDYDETMLELDSGVILEEVDAGREMIALQAINDAGLSNMLAHSKGKDLENLGAMFGITRAITGYADADKTVPIYEKDDRLRRRIQLAPEALAKGGSEGGYIFQALAPVGAIADATAENPAPGEIVVTVMSERENPAATTDEVNTVREHLMQEDIKVDTDILTVQGAEVITVDLEADIVLYRGPDSTAVLADAKKNLETFLALNKRLGRDLKLFAWLGRLSRDTVYGVVPVTPLADVVADRDQVIWVRSITLNPAGVGE